LDWLRKLNPDMKWEDVVAGVAAILRWYVDPKHFLGISVHSTAGIQSKVDAPERAI
jgi:hypothetical protein